MRVFTHEQTTNPTLYRNSSIANSLTVLVMKRCSYERRHLEVQIAQAW